MINRILVALDYSDTCQGVFEQAIDLAQSTQSTLHLLSVLAPPETDSALSFAPYSDPAWASYAERYQEMESAGLNALKSFVDKAEAAGVQTDCTQERGNPGTSICKLAATLAVDLIIVGSHGRKGLSEMLLGSVSNYVVHHATCSVMVVHQRPA